MSVVERVERKASTWIAVHESSATVITIRTKRGKPILVDAAEVAWLLGVEEAGWTLLPGGGSINVVPHTAKERTALEAVTRGDG
jgi:hypothetical protein